MTNNQTKDVGSLNNALKAFEAAEANLDKLDRLWCAIKELVPEGVVFGDNAKHEELTRTFCDVASHLPAIDGWQLKPRPLNYNEIAQVRFDAMEAGEIECKVAAENHIFELDSELREYRFRLNRKRRDIVRVAMERKIEAVNGLLASMQELIGDDNRSVKIEDPKFESLRKEVSEIDMLMGGSVNRPPRWTDLSRHLHFGMLGDLSDIIEHDWPSVKPALLNSLIGENDPIPVSVQDLGELVVSSKSDNVIAALNWHVLNDAQFERLIFNLIGTTEGYENPQWLMQTKASDKGRDLSVTRVTVDKLAGTIRSRVIIQCKHWLTKSISIDDISKLQTLLKLWEPPRIDVCVIATSGRFTTQAVDWIEKRAQSDQGMKIEMWPESHLEQLLVQRPGLIAEFGLR